MDARHMFDAGNKLFGVIGLLAFGSFFLGGVGMCVYNYRMYSKMERAEGVAVKFKQGMHGHGPHVQFHVNDQTYVISGQIEVSGGRGIARGETVGVLYQPDDPSSGVLDLFLDKWFSAGIFTGVGFAGTLISLVMLFVPNRREPRETATGT